MSKDYTVTYRPRKLDQIVGNESAVKTIRSWIRSKSIPQQILFTGPSGCGKTTLARILKKALKSRGVDYCETNAALHRGIDMIRDIKDRINLDPMMSKARVWVIDEAHQLTKDAQDAVLKVLEDCRKTSYVIICTTRPTKLIRTIHTRCTEVKVTGQKPAELIDLIKRVWTAEKPKRPEIDEDVLDRIVEVAEGSARKALKVLQSVINLKKKDDVLDAIQKSDSRRAAFDLVKALIPFQGKPNWNEVKKVLIEIEDEEPEGVRRLILSVCASHILKGGPMSVKSLVVFEEFRDNFFDTGRPGLIAACFRVVFRQ